MLKLNLNNIFLFVGLIALPIAGLLLHLRLHPDLTFLTWILWFDIIVISLLYLWEKTRFYGFVLNSVFFIVGVIMHAMYVPGGGISDILISIPDFSIGFALWVLNRKNIENCLNKPKKDIPKIISKPLAKSSKPTNNKLEKPNINKQKLDKLQ